MANEIYCMNADKKYADSQNGKRVIVLTDKSKNIKDGLLGTYYAKHVEIPLHYILLDGEQIPKIFHIFDLHWI